VIDLRITTFACLAQIQRIIRLTAEENNTTDSIEVAHGLMRDNSNKRLVKI